MKKLLSRLSQLPAWSIVVFALFIRTAGLWDSFWLDEAAQALESTRPLSQQLQIAEDFQPPLLHLIVHFAAQVSQNEAWLRLWGALLPGLITIYCTYKIAEKLFSKQVAFISSFLLAVSSFHVFYSQELRPYSLSAAFATLSWLLLVQAFFVNKKFTAKDSMLYALTTALGLYSTYLYPFVVISQAVYVFWKERQALKGYLVSGSIAALLFVPWIPSFLEQLSVGQALRKSLPGWEAVVSIPQLKSLPLTLGKFMFGVLNIEMTVPFILTIIIFLLGLAATAWLVWTNRNKFFYSKQFILILCWLSIPLLSSWLFSFAIPVVQPKRVLYLLPAFYIFVYSLLAQAQEQDSSLLQRVTSKVRQQQNSTIVKLMLVASTVWILLGLSGWSLISYIQNPVYQRENWRAIHQQILERYPTKAAVVFAFDAAFAPWRWYDDGSYPVFATGSLTTATQGEVDEKLKKTSDYQYVLVFDYLRDLTDPNRKIETALENLGYSEKEVFGMPGIGFVRVFARQEDVLS